MALALKLVPLWCLACLCQDVVLAVNDRPIIGVLTQPMEKGSPEDILNGRTYIAASYVKFAESAGARVVPIHFDASDAELRSIFGQINGIIFPGGGAELRNVTGNRFRQAAQLLYSLALDANDRGDPFPIHGTCLGFQLLSLLTAQDDRVLCQRCFKTEGTPLPLNFTEAAKSSKLFETMSPLLFSALATEGITENSHTSGVVPGEYVSNGRLREFYTVLSTNIDVNESRFVSTIEAKQYPITATQWHPEKNNFEWGSIGKLGKRAIPHSANAVAVSQYFANAFVANARLSHHRFVSELAETEALIYNYHPVKDPNGYFELEYVWNRSIGVQEPMVV